VVSIARKNILAEKTRFAASVGGVAFSILLIIFLLGVYNAFNVLTTAYLDSVDADIVVAQEGVTDMFHTYSSLPISKINQVKRVSGGEAYGLASQATNVLVREEDGSKIIDFTGRKKDEDEGEKDLLNIIGFDSTNNIGGPWEMIEGDPSPSGKEIVVDKVFTKRNNLVIGDQIEVLGEIFTITGISDKNNMMVYTRAFLDIKEAQEILKSKDRVNFIFVKLEDSSQTEMVVDKLKGGVSGVSVYTIGDFAESNAKSISESFLPIIAVVTLIGFLTGAVVVGLTVYTATMEKIKEYGVLKAIGATNKKLFLIVFEQALWSSVIGFIVGIALVNLVAVLIREFVPVVPLVFGIEQYALGFVSALAMSLFASYLPLRKIANIDPAEVFRK